MLTKLTEALTKQQAISSYRHLTDHFKHCVSVAPAALAHILKGADLTEGRVKILVIGAEIFDFFDKGNWFGLVPHILKTSIELDMTFLGPNLTSKKPKAGNDIKRNITTTTYEGTLKSFLQTYPEINSFDCAILFQPGFYGDAGCFSMLADGSLQQLLESEIPCYWTAYAEDEYLHDTVCLADHGFHSTRPEINPYGLEVPIPPPSPPLPTVWAGHFGKIRLVEPNKLPSSSASVATHRSIEEVCPSSLLNTGDGHSLDQ